MPITPSDSNRNISSGVIREILTLENELDKHLLDKLIDGKTSYILTASSREVVDILVKRYQKVGWNVKVAYSGEALFRLEFEDPRDVTRRLKPLSADSLTTTSDEVKRGK